MADTASDTKDGGSLSRPEQRKLRDEGSGALGVSKLVSGPLESEPKDSGNPESKFLTPQWLLSKPGDSKPPALSGDPPRSPGAPSPGYGMNDAPGKDRWRNVEGAPQDPKRGRDWWRTISLERDADSSRRERWREEERESSNNLAPRRDRWKEGERDAVGDQGPQPQNRRGANERWPEMNPAGGRESGEPLRRVPSERWADTANRESNFDSRRDSKWSNRWGPDEKEREFRGKWGGDGVEKEGGKYGMEGGKDGMEAGGYHLRHVANAHNVVRDGDREREREREREKERERDREREREREREPDASRNDRAWRPSFASRGRGENPHLGSTPPKMAPGFMTGRGRGEPYGVGFTVGRGRGNLQSGLLHGPPLSPIGSPYVGDKWDVGKENAFRYPRVKLLDIHRKCGILSFQKYPDGFTEVTQLTQSDPVEPMAFFQPDAEEEAILDGIRKGEIVSSGAVHNSVSKDGRGLPRQDSLGRGRGRGRGLVGKEDAGFDGHREDDFFDKPGFGSAQGGDGGAFDKLAEARFADAEESWESRGRMESSTDNDGAKDENSWRPGRDDGRWRPDSVARSDGSWRKSRAGDEGTAVGNKEEKTERQDRMGERDDRSSWRRPEQVESKAEHGVSAEKGMGTQEARRSDLEGNLQSRDGVAVGGKSEEQASRNEGYSGGEVGKGSQAASSKEGASRQETALDQVAPEDLCLYYTDPQGEIQGPFLGVDIIGWFDAGYFELDLPVRLVDAPEGTPFIPLENVMPHLKPAVKVPPGFNSLKQAEEVGESSHMRGDVHSSNVGFRVGESSANDVELKSGGGGLEPSLDIDLLGLSDTSKTLFGGDFQLGLNGRASTSKVGYPEVAVDKHYSNAEKNVGGKGEESGEQAFRRRMSTFPRVDTDVPDVLNLEAGNHFAQNQGLGSLPGQPFSASKAPRSSTLQADPSSMPQNLHGHGVPNEQAWGDRLLRNLSLDAQFSHVGLPPSGNGIDPTHLAQQLEHLELQNLQRMGSTGSGLQRQLSGVPPSPQSSRMNMEQLMRPGGLGSRDQVLNPLLPQMPPQAHQPGVAIPPSGPVLEQLLRMQQQQQQQQHVPTQVLIEQLLRNQPMPPPAHFDHLHRQGSGLADQLLLGRQGPDPRLLDVPGQHLSGREFDQLLLGRQNHTSPSPFEQLVRQRQQEELQSPMLPFGLPVPQPHQSLEDMRVSGVWEVDEYGQFVKRQQSPGPLRTFEAFQQQQLQQQQQQQQRLQSQLNFPTHLQHEAQDTFGFDSASLMDAGLMEHRVPMNMFDGSLLRRERSGLSGIGQMEGDLVAQIQEQQQRSRGERQSNVPAFMEAPGVFSDLDRFHRDVFDLRQVQERQQQVEAAAAARVLGLGTNTGQDAMEGRPKSGERRMGQVEGPGTSSLLSGLRWPLMNNEAPERQEMAQERNIFPPSLGLWGQESHEYGVPEHLMQGGGRNGAAMSDHVPIAAKASAGDTPRSSSVASTPPEVPHMLGNWNLSNLHSNDAAGETQSSEGQFVGGSVGSLIQPGWKAPAVPKPKSLAEIQEEEAASKKVGEKVNVEAGGQSTGAGSAGFGPWAAASVLQPKSLREIQEEEAKKVASQRVAAQEAGQLLSSASTVGQKSPSSRGGDPSAWGGVSLNEKGSSLLDAGEEQVVAPTSRKSTEQEASGLNQTSVGQSTQTASQSGPVFDDSDFIEPKESKKSKKRAAKAKSTTLSGKTAVGGTVAEASPLTSSKSTAARSVQVEAAEESLAAPPPGPSLADFLHLGSEPAASAQPLPAWSTTPSRQAKAAKSLKEIQEAEKRAREEQVRQNQILQASLAAKNAPPPSAKPITLMTRSGSGGAAWQRPGAATPTVQAAVGGQQGKVVTSTGSSAAMGSSRSKVGVFEDDDDLFWDYGQDAKMTIGAVKQAAKSEPLDFPTLAPVYGVGKPSVAVKSGGVSSLPVFRNATAPAAVVRASPSDFPSLSATSVVTKATATKTKNQGSNKGAQVSAEQKALRQWCESQLKKMNYNEDPDVDFSIVDFCITLPSVSEAGDYLSQYISTLAFVTPTQVQAFKKEFVRRKEQLPGDGNVSSSDREDMDGLYGGANGKVVGRSKSGAMDMARLLKEDNNSGDYESITPGRGKKKGKKGKKVVDPSLLGFSVTSNRIMMGEIHHIDD